MSFLVFHSWMFCSAASGTGADMVKTVVCSVPSPMEGINECFVRVGVPLISSVDVNPFTTTWANLYNLVDRSSIFSSHLGWGASAKV